MTKQNRIRRDASYRKRAFAIGVLDVICINLAYALALWLKFDFHLSAIPELYVDTMLRTMPGVCLVYILIFGLFGLYNSIWSFVSVDELLRIIGAYLVIALAEAAMFFRELLLHLLHEV